MTVCQKLGMILENKVVQKSRLENISFDKKWSSKLVFFNEKEIKHFLAFFDIKNRL